MTQVEAIPALEESAVSRALIARNSLLVLVLAIVCFTVKLGGAPLARTEGHRVITAHQMVESGNYLIPKLYGHVYLRKPPLQYWVLAGFEKMLGPTEFANRLPSALATALLAMIVCIMTSRWFEDSLAGFVAGILCIGLVPLWSQARAADIDALNTLASVTASLVIIELGWRAENRVPDWVIAMGGIAFGASLLAKGPAGLPIIAGAMIGPAIAGRTWRPLKSGWIYLVLLIGCLMFVGWILAVLAVAGTAPAQADSSGLKEAQFKFYIASLQQLWETITMPFLVLAFGFPLTLTLLFPFVRSLNSNLEPRQSELIRAIGVTILTAFALQFVTGTGNPRYAYLNLPLFCPLAGAIAYAWFHKLLPRQFQQHTPAWLPTMAILYSIVAIVMFVLSRRDGLNKTMLFGGIAVASIIGLVGLISALKERLRFSALITTVAICVAIVSFGIQKNGERTRASAFSVSPQLRSALFGTTSRIGTANVVWAEPEIFYYAGVKPEVLPSLDKAHTSLPSEDTWFVMDAEEWQSWQRGKDARRGPGMVRQLRLYNKNLVYVCWYSPSGNPPPTAAAE